MTPILTSNCLDFISHDAVQTQRVGERLGRMLGSADLVCLEGDLGAGKTCLAQGIGRGLGLTSAVTSPTFIIVNEYPLLGRAYRLYHIDLYRVDSTAEACSVGLEDYFNGDGICVIEWPERALDILPDERLWITLHYVDDTTRQLRFEAQGPRSEDLLERLRQQALGV